MKTTTGNLFGAPASNPSTSAAAATAITPHVPRLEALVLDRIRAAGSAGLCNHELEMVLKMPGNTVRPRVRKLVTFGLVRDSGKTRLTESKRSAIVWVAA